MSFYDLKEIPEHLKEYFEEVPQLGLEPTLEEHVNKMVALFREVRRVLRDDGTLWLNYGDRYASGGRHEEPHKYASADAEKPTRPQVRSLKPKDLVGMPWRVAFGLQAEGWYLRSDIIWHKPNPMPESVTDRPTKAHEYIFLLSKSQKYFYDADAVREAHAEPERGHGERERNNWSIDGNRGSKPTKREYNPAGRNLRDVWTIVTQPMPDAHFATFPVKLVEPCIKAGTSEKGCCVVTGKPLKRILKQVNPNAITSGRRDLQNKQQANEGRLSLQRPTGITQDQVGVWATVGWEDSENGGTKPCAVFDPFMGAGTTMIVAEQLGRAAIGIELNPKYVEIAMRRWEKLTGEKAVLKS